MTAGIEASGDVEIVAPIADAMGELARLVSHVPGSLAGASIARSVSGTLLLNAAAWTLFGDALKRALPAIVTRIPAASSAKPLKFLLLSAPVDARSR